MSAVIFDWSGVISNDFRLVLQGINHVLGAFGKPNISGDEFRRSFALGLTEQYIKNGITDLEGARKLYEDVFNRDGKPTPVPGAVNHVKEMVSLGFQVVVFSSHPTSLLEREIQDYGLGDSGIAIVAGQGKGIVPNKWLEARIGSEKRDVLYFGDTTVDISFANRSGFMSVAVASEYAYHDRKTLLRAKPRYVITSLEDAPCFARCLLPRDKMQKH